jgi:hypothetical protein
MRTFEDCVERIPESGCWLWLAGVNGDGYGFYQTKRAHRVSYEMFVGPINGLHVLHRCDVPCCVNPAHLFLGTHAQNMADRDRKTRGFRKPGMGKLTAEQVLAIRKMAGSNGQIAAQFGVTDSNIEHIKARRTWKHI